MDRRSFVGAGGVLLAAGAVSSARAESARTVDVAEIGQALARTAELPGRTSYLIKVSGAGRDWSAAQDPDERMFVGSAVKTFILAQALKDVEDGRLDEDAPVAVDDEVRSLSSPVLLELSGKTPLRTALEAMIAHSDNTATDIALKAVGADRVRAFVAEAGLASVAVPTSTRRLFSYLAGAPDGVDAGWDALRRVDAGETLGDARSPLNDRETMQASARDLVSYYERTLAGRFFRAPETLAEFKRISAMANALPMVVPPDLAAYGKGGSIEWGGFRCLCLPGQMVLGDRTTVTFSFTVNWNVPPKDVGPVQKTLVSVISGVLSATARAFG